LIRFLIAGIGGFIGAALRYIITNLSVKVLGNAFPYGTLFVNISGGFLIGFIMEASNGLWSISLNIRTLLVTGILGGLTTFSTFSYETMNMINDGHYLMACINACLNLFLSLLGVWLGKFLAQVI